MPSTSATGVSGSGRSHATTAANKIKTTALIRKTRATGRRATMTRPAMARAVACDASGCKTSTTAHKAYANQIQRASWMKLAIATTKAGSSSAAAFAWTGPTSSQRCTPIWPGLARLASNPAGAAKIMTRAKMGEAKRETVSATTAPTLHVAIFRSQAPAGAPSRATTRQPEAIATNDKTVKTAKKRLE